MTVQARESGVLRAGHERLWMTFSLEKGDCRLPAGDYFLERGESLPLAAGQIVVMESWPKAASGEQDGNVEKSEQGVATPACVSWKADAPLCALADLRRALVRPAAQSCEPHQFVLAVQIKV